MEKHTISERFVTINIDPGDKTFTVPWPKTVRQLLKSLNLAEGAALVARDGKLLTPDRQIWPDDSIYIRVVISMG